MRRMTFGIMSVAFALVLIGCSKSETSNNSNSTTNTSGSSTSTTSEKSAASSPASETASTSSSEKIGVPECDDFIAKYDACVSDKVPEMVRAQYQASLKQWRESWKKLAENPQTKGSLAAACKTAREQQEAALKSFGCKF